MGLAFGGRAELHWTYAEDLSGERVQIEDSEAHHMLHVLRMKAGAAVTLFDGRGSVVDAVVEGVTKRDVTCRVLGRVNVPAPGSGGVTVAVSPPKGDRLRWMVEKLTEMGISRLILLQTERTVVTPGETRLEKLRSSVIAACKQSKRPWLMELGSLTGLSEVLSWSQDAQLSVYLAHPGAGVRAGLWHPSGPSGRLLLIGPEGGFSESEVAGIGPYEVARLVWPGTILRTETAAIVFSGLLQAGCMDRKIVSPDD